MRQIMKYFNKMYVNYVYSILLISCVSKFEEANLNNISLFNLYNRGYIKKNFLTISANWKWN